MKILRKVLLINWLNYSFQEVEFGKITFLTGKNASGKSTLIDAMQLVLLGDTTGRFFNQAANEKSGRTLESYLYGYKGDDGNMSQSVMRDGNFTSYVVLEFFDEEKSRSFCLGFMAYCPKDRKSMRHYWFILHDSPIIETKFLDLHNKPYNREELKEYLEDNFKGSYEWFESNSRYQEAALFEMGELKKKYHSTLRKAVPFAPILNIADFITEYICDVNNEIDITDMQKSIRGYSELESEAKNIQTKIHDLEFISEKYNAYVEIIKLMKRNNYYSSRVAIEADLAEIKKCELKIQNISADLIMVSQRQKEVRNKIDSLESEQKRKFEEKALNQDYIRKVRLSSKIDDIQRKMNDINDGISKIVFFLKKAGNTYSKLLSDLKHCGVNDADTFSEFVDNLKNIVDSYLPELDLYKISDNFSSLSQMIQNMRFRYKEEYKANEVMLDRLSNEIQQLEKGMKAYPEYALEFKNDCETALGHPFAFFADTVEFTDYARGYEQYIEGWLDEKRFYLIVEDDEVAIVEEILRSKYSKSGAGFIYPSQIEQMFNTEDSFIYALNSDNPVAQTYADVILSSLFKKGNRPYLDEDGIITASQSVYSINKENYMVPFIGQSAITKQLELKKNDMQILESKMKNLGTVIRVLPGDTFSYFQIDPTRIEDFSKKIAAMERIGELTVQLEKAKEEYESLDLLTIEQLDNELNSIENKIAVARDEEKELISRNTALEIDRMNAQTSLTEKNASLASKQTDIRHEYDEEFIAESEPLFKDLYTAKKHNDIAEDIKNTYKKYDEAIKKHWNELVKLRQVYNELYHMSYDTLSETNEEYDKELHELSDNALPQYLNDIAEAKKTAYSQLRNDFLSKMSDNIKRVEYQIRDFNKTLSKYNFGGDTYEFTVTPSKDNKKFYDMFMDNSFVLEQDFDDTLFADEFNKKYGNELEQLFEILIPGSESSKSDSEKEKQIKQYTDYKTYLTFDMNVKGPNGDVQKLSRNMQYKSGGETQIPFYISILVSFAQVCRMKDIKGKSTVRLVIFDEAFSKMDGERIRTCLKLLKDDFDLQVIFSAPPEKISDVIKYTGNILVAYKNAEGAHIEAFSTGENLTDE